MAGPDDQTPSDEPVESVEEAIIRMSRRTHERLPMLEVVLGRTATSLGPALAEQSSASVSTNINSIEYLSCAEALDGLPKVGVYCTVTADTGSAPMIIGVDADFMMPMLDYMLGGRVQKKKKWFPRSFTGIETKLGLKICQVVVSEIQANLKFLEEARFEIEEAVSKPGSVLLGPPTAPCVTVYLNATVEGYDGLISILIPFGAVEDIKRSLSSPSSGASFNWKQQLLEHLEKIPVEVYAILHDVKVPLTDALSWQVGSSIDLGIAEDHVLSLYCDKTKLFLGEMGQRANGTLAVNVTEVVEPEAERAPPEEEPEEEEAA